MGVAHLDRITGIVLILGKGADEDRTVDTDRIHRRHHLIAVNMVGPFVRRVPGTVRWIPGTVRRIGGIYVDLRINDRHGTVPLLQAMHQANC